MKLIRVLAVGFVAAAVVVAVAGSRRRGRPNSVAEAGGAPPVIPGALGQFVTALNSAQDEDEPVYREALAMLQQDADQALAAARALLQRAAASDFSVRHSVVLAIAAMRAPGALGLLEEVALNPQPLPPGDLPLHVEPHDVEDAVQGTIVALDAVDGLEALADDGHEPAVEALVRAVRVPSNAIRAAALTALAARPERNAFLQRALAELPSEVRHLAELRRMEVGQAPQVRDPRATLIGLDAQTPAAPALDDLGTSVPPSPSGRGGAPTIPRR